MCTSVVRIFFSAKNLHSSAVVESFAVDSKESTGQIAFSDTSSSSRFRYLQSLLELVGWRVVPLASCHCNRQKGVGVVDTKTYNNTI